VYVPVVNLFQSCDLELDPMTFTYEHDLYCLEIHRKSVFHVKSFESYHRTERRNRLRVRKFLAGNFRKFILMFSEIC